MNASAISAFIWSVADLLRGDYKQSDYGKVILPFTLLRRLDCVLAPTRDKVLAEHQKRRAQKVPEHEFLLKASGAGFYNVSSLDFDKLLADPGNIRGNVLDYIRGFSPQVGDIFERYDFERQVVKLDEANLLYRVVQKFGSRDIDLSPQAVDNTGMGLIFEELIRRFSELSNETAGEHYTPREVIRLMVDLLFQPDADVLGRPHAVRSLYDPTAGTGGMLSVAEDYLRELNPSATLRVYGQELNPESYAICKADMLIKGQGVANIAFGNTLSNDGHEGETFDYGLANPPFGVEWKKVQDVVLAEHRKQGFNGRFGPGLPRVSDGSLLFLLHLVSKMRHPAQGGGRIGIVLNGSPLFTGNAGSGESEIRRWLLENDLVDAIVALPTDMFYNTGIATYVWVLSNRKPAERKGRVILVNGVDFFQKMRKSLGSKRRMLGDDDIERIVRLYADYADTQHSKVFATTDFGYHTITVERPLRLAFAVTAERLARLDDSKPLVKMGKDLEALKDALAGLGADTTWNDRAKFLKDAKKVVKAAGLKLSAAQWKAVWTELGERDEDAEICLDKDGQPEPDPSLRDTENVPMAEEIEDYFWREVQPHVPDAWIDTEKTKVGYEIPFTRHFYKYVPPRPLEEIDAELKALSREIVELLGSGDSGSDRQLPRELDPPAHWVPARLRYVSQLNPPAPRSLPADLAVSFLPMEAVGDDGTLNLDRTIEAGAAGPSYTYFAEGDVSVAKVTPCFENGKGAVMNSLTRGHAFASSELVNLRPSQHLNADFLYALTMSHEFRAWGVATMTGAGGLKRVANDYFRNVKFALPPVGEQLDVVSFLRREAGRIETLLAKQKRLTELLQEKRQALISGAVTGKIDVREAA